MTLLAVPAPPLFTVIVKPMLSVELTDVASAVLLTVRSGQFTVIVAVEVLLACAPVASLVAEAVAELTRGPQSDASVVPLTLTVRLSPLFRSPNVQLKALLPLMVQPALPVFHVTPAGKVSVSVTPRAIPKP